MGFPLGVTGLRCAVMKRDNSNDTMTSFRSRSAGIDGNLQLSGDKIADKWPQPSRSPMATGAPSECRSSSSSSSSSPSSSSSSSSFFFFFFLLLLLHRLYYLVKSVHSFSACASECVCVCVCFFGFPAGLVVAVVVYGGLYKFYSHTSHLIVRADGRRAEWLRLLRW